VAGNCLASITHLDGQMERRARRARRAFAPALCAEASTCLLRRRLYPTSAMGCNLGIACSPRCPGLFLTLLPSWFPFLTYQQLAPGILDGKTKTGPSLAAVSLDSCLLFLCQS
jgi:hypothetical protein